MSTTVCGTGDGSGARLPNDPDFDNITISASALLYGIQVSWSYPMVNPWAVSYWVLYRSTESDFAFAQPIARVSGSTYFDAFDSPEYGDTYYYWVQGMSFNGLEGEVAGPASATFQPPIQTVIDFLEGSVDESVLNQALKTEIRKITDLASALSDEEQERLLGENFFTQLLEQFRADLGNIDTLVANEIIERIQGDEALVAQINLMLAKSNDNAAAIQTESAVRATELGALAFEVQTLQATAGNVDQLNEISASIQTTQQVVAELEGDLSATYMVKTQVDPGTGEPLIAGFGLYNDGITSDFIVRADRFAVGLPSQDGVFPFIIDTVNGENVIALNAKALIPDASIGIAQVEKILSSSNYVPGQRGWTLHSDTGYAEFQNLKARGNITANRVESNEIYVDTLNIRNNAVTVPIVIKNPAGLKVPVPYLNNTTNGDIIKNNSAIVIQKEVDFGSNAPTEVIINAGGAIAPNGFGTSHGLVAAGIYLYNPSRGVFYQLTQTNFSLRYGDWGLIAMSAGRNGWTGSLTVQLRVWAANATSSTYSITNGYINVLGARK